ncbi:Na(+)-translocating NADH-quinone reductase subunit F [Tamlana agarivorans]|uniref:Na(+)-translocating NADH-quinone reductase subunit F n=1 Tax=Pseudotamlana agarivorans TaxID=481183 RepID=A0ACC5UAQ0_9FLAO|nr:Na(+)-translocating NADH-quinone reductase subunit F [Tamlana agarivorans]MBU2951308.1 Na(+)-translocating NADH-quinone reductase subunit F [Tamlana agarivorans]
MKTTLRFETAINKLYTAFHNNKLNPECCKQCAVGNILDQTDGWQYLSDDHGGLQLNYVGKVHQSLGRKFNGYTPIELLQIEHEFLEACGFKTPLHHSNQKPINTADKDTLFQGLYAVVTLLCKLDNIPNVMDYTRLLEVHAKKQKFTF